MDKTNNLYTGSGDRKMGDEASSVMINSKSNSPNVRIYQNISKSLVENKSPIQTNYEMINCQNTVLRDNKKAILNLDDVRMERSKSDLSSYDNRGTEKVSAYKSINKDDVDFS